MLSYTLCTYNRANRLPDLIRAMRRQNCTIPFEILVVDNNSQDRTLEVLDELAREDGVPLRIVTEKNQGIVYARNRAIREAMDSNILVFIDDDELPLPGHIQAATDSIEAKYADCVGGRILVDFEPSERPSWLNDEILGFLGSINHGPKHFAITTDKTPVWSGNVAYRVQYLKDNPDIRFDPRYNRTGYGVGGGEDAIMLHNLLDRKARIYYNPDMTIKHLVEARKLNRRFFLKLHYIAGVRRGRYEVPNYPAHGLPMPPFMIAHFIKQSAKTIACIINRQSSLLRQAMTTANTLGVIVGYTRRN